MLKFSIISVIKKKYIYIYIYYSSSFHFHHNWILDRSYKTYKHFYHKDEIIYFFIHLYKNLKLNFEFSLDDYNIQRKSNEKY